MHNKLIALCDEAVMYLLIINDEKITTHFTSIVVKMILKTVGFIISRNCNRKP